MSEYVLPGAASQPMTKWLRSRLEVDEPEVNPGLLLDRLVALGAFDQKTSQFPHLGRVVASMEKAGGESQAALADWDRMVLAVGAGAHAWTQRTVWHLALHLSRAIALENASLCLHPVYGFPYIPGTGLKGLASTYAELECGQTDEWQRIFGTTAGAGSVVFLDAWPAEWPKIKVDITNNHHRDYYSSKGQEPPGDWESPVPVYFLVVAPDVEFKFAVAPASPRTSAGDLATARAWLQRGLQELGAGAKTAAGYGYFSEPQCYPPSSKQPGEEITGELEEFQRKHKKLSTSPNASDVGQAVVEVERLEDQDLRRQAAEWVFAQLKGNALLQHSPKKRPDTYEERLLRCVDDVTDGQ